MSRSDALALLRHVLERGREAVPRAWQEDRLFRYAAIGLGLTAVLLLMRLGGPDAPELHAPPRMLPGERSTVTGVGTSPRPPKMSELNEPEVPKIAPGQGLDAVTVAPATGSDRFGTFTSGPRP